MTSEIRFYKETNFKETPIGKIPEDWKSVRYIDVADYINGYPFKPSDWKSEGLPIIRIQNLTGKEEYNYYQGPVEDWYLVKNGDLLFSWSATIDIFIWNGGNAVLNQHIFKVIPKNNIDRKFLYYIIKNYLENIKRKIHGSTMKHFKKEQLVKNYLPLPPVTEQKAIAKILSTVDLAIQKVDEIIAKTERLKKGLMQELLTKGIGHKEFKDTEIGRIPKEWKIVKVGDVLSLEYGSGLSERERIPGTYPVVGSNGIVGYHNQARVKGPGIVVGRKGTIGAVSWIDRDFWPIDTTYYVRTKTTNVSLKWLFYELIYLNPARFHLADVVPGLRRELVHSLKMILPPLREQQRIAEILSAADKKLELERNEKAKLERIKQGLMDLLLTGKIRVKVN
jgi:type I restriction enzyme S subunit